MLKVQLPPEAKVDLSATVSGQFSAEDWGKILARAEAELSAKMNDTSDYQLAWQDVVRDFYSGRYWGFEPKTKSELKKIDPKPPRKNMGVKLIWITFNTMCVTKVIVVWLGQVYSRSQDSLDFFWLLLAIALVVANFGFFLWQNRNYQD